MIAQLPDAVTAALWAMVAFSVLVVVRAIWFGLRDLRALAASAKSARDRLGEATALLEQETGQMREATAALQARSNQKEA